MNRRTSAFHPYQPLADALATLLAPLVEVAIHDMESDTLAYVAAPMSPREPGDPSGLRDLGPPSQSGYFGPYEKTNWDGKRLRSISVPLPGQPASMLCINVDVSRFEAMRDMLEMMMTPINPVTVATTPALFRQDWHETLNRFVAEWSRARKVNPTSLDRHQRRSLIAAIYESGGFEAPRSVIYIARLINVSRATIYNELADLKKDALQPEKID
ncbi:MULTISPECIES: helix-turn-helix transcriptional regulator [unclassified Rhizobium]|uniref:helix-turn-helix transcriptional regulator n=1 Tax=Rhizobium sp. PP-CC-3G-465 TaxID=2135648 RepID=UPI000D9F6100|nr:putative transcriptional regulator YheO [Rhizobium sp. PP-WC-1G-195]TCQ13606.1 putative transcriptional regulator YheO [Rhizobium sp. PP-CC-3G-465]